MSINDYITDKAIEIIGYTEQILKLATTSLNKEQREKLEKMADKITAISKELREKI